MLLSPTCRKAPSSSSPTNSSTPCRSGNTFRSEGAWRECVVGLDADRKLMFGIGAGTTSVDGVVAQRTVEGSVMEVCPAAGALMTEIARRIVDHGGAALIMDYGYNAPPIGDTLQAVRAHQYADPLDTPGEADLTAHVDFSALAKSARTAGASVHGPTNQGDFLVSLGLLERAGRLGRNADETRARRCAWRSSVSPARIRWARFSRQSPSHRRASRHRSSDKRSDGRALTTIL